MGSLATMAQIAADLIKIEGLLAEGSLRELQSRLHRIDLEDGFGLLLKTATSDVIGCVTVEPVSGE